jgi:Domain of Unknown Function (DUF1080)
MASPTDQYPIGTIGRAVDPPAGTDPHTGLTPLRDDQWKTIEIKAIKHQIFCSVNGNLSDILTDRDAIFESRGIALRCGPTALIQMKDVLIRRLPEDPVQSEPARRGVQQSEADGLAAEKGFVPLLNGKDRTGWVLGGNPVASWSVENGVLVGRSPVPVAVLNTVTSDYNNFHFRVETVLSEGANSGMNFRERPDGRPDRAFIGGTNSGEASKTADLYGGTTLLADAEDIDIEPGK